MLASSTSDILEPVADAWWHLGLIDPSFFELAKDTFFAGYTLPTVTPNMEEGFSLLIRHAQNQSALASAQEARDIARALLCYLYDLLEAQPSYYDKVFKPTPELIEKIKAQQTTLYGYKQDSRVLALLVKLHAGHHAFSHTNITIDHDKAMEYALAAFNTELDLSTLDNLFFFHDFFTVCFPILQASDLTAEQKKRWQNTLQVAIESVTDPNMPYTTCNTLITTLFLIWHGFPPALKEQYANQLSPFSFSPANTTLSDFFGSQYSSLLKPIMAYAHSAMRIELRKIGEVKAQLLPELQALITILETMMTQYPEPTYATKAVQPKSFIESRTPSAKPLAQEPLVSAHELR